MARILIVGCSADGLSLASELRNRGHLVRCTAASEEERAAIEGAGVEAVLADPDRLGTLLEHLHGVSAVAWLAGDSPRLEPLAETLVDTHVRGLVCEPGPGAEAARASALRSNVGFETAPDSAGMAAAVDRVLAV